MTDPKLATMDIGAAVSCLLSGMLVRRQGWNGQNQFLYHVPASQFAVNRPPLLGIYEEGKVINYRGHIDINTEQGECVPWICSQSDLLATDWIVVDREDVRARVGYPVEPSAVETEERAASELQPNVHGIGPDTDAEPHAQPVAADRVVTPGAGE